MVGLDHKLEASVTNWRPLSQTGGLYHKLAHVNEIFKGDDVVQIFWYLPAQMRRFFVLEIFFSATTYRRGLSCAMQAYFCLNFLAFSFLAF